MGKPAQFTVQLDTKKNLLPYNYIKKANSNIILMQHLPEAFNFWLKIPDDKLRVIMEAAGYLVQAAVLLDDVQDGTQYRRNLPSTDRIYGIPLSVNSSVFCLIVALEKLKNLQNSAVFDIYCKEVKSALDGIAADLYWRDAFVCPTEDEYKAMVIKKTGSYLLLKFGLMQAFSANRGDYHELLNTLGLYYQIRDEYINLTKLEALEGKSNQHELMDLKNLMFCEDITEGRFTFPLIHGLNSSEGPTIRSILVQRTSDSIIKQHCLSLLEKVGSLDYTRRTLHDLDGDLREQHCLSLLEKVGSLDYTRRTLHDLDADLREQVHNIRYSSSVHQ
ncbi:geranylgeranyl pyrophosphate synthase-like [Aricia agestis]|uniref:geranylgeranyl pyrophosphate synthase-like n=1 Tax=Aricia agestis TaxID=91739 RepID=UPI001C2028DF|nr:geranylgeranyl pyrophosphate synthase-like [Aricia agestis]